MIPPCPKGRCVALRYVCATPNPWVQQCEPEKAYPIERQPQATETKIGLLGLLMCGMGWDRCKEEKVEVEEWKEE